MRPSQVLPVLVGVMLGIAIAGACRPREPNPDRELPVIRQVLDDQQAAWNRGDLAGFMTGYWNSERLEFRSGGTLTRGWEPTAARYRKRYLEGGAEMGTLTFSEVDVELLGRDRAVVVGRWALQRKVDSPHGWFTLQLRKFADGWKIVSDHTSSADQ